MQLHSVSQCVSACACVCVYVWVCSTWLGGAKHIDLSIVRFLPGLLHSFSSSACLEAAGTGAASQPSWCLYHPDLLAWVMTKSKPWPIRSVQFTSTFQELVRFCHGPRCPFWVHRCPGVSPPSRVNLTISGQLVLYDWPPWSVELCLLSCISLPC